jgi:glycosyltransferase involved in cell wall biosynthesis
MKDNESQPPAGAAAPVAVFTVTQGEGHGSETVLANLLRAPLDTPLVVLAPRRSRALRAAADAGHAVFELSEAADRLVVNLAGALRAVTTLRACRAVHAWTARAFDAALLGARLAGRPLTGTLHDHPHAGFHGRTRRRLMRLAANRMVSLACVSRAVADACREAGYRCALPVIHNGLADLPVAARDGAVPSPVRVGFLGMYAAWKGFDLVVRLAAEMPRAAPVQWRLYGEPCAANRRLLDNLAPAARAACVPCGAVSTERIFGEIDILLHASRRFDPLPTVLIEAARAGLPCVCTRVGGAEEVCVDGRTGFVFDPAEPRQGARALERLVRDAALRRTMGREARQRFEAEFSLPRMASAYAELWRRGTESAP